ncbi:MAG: rod shape-determining protein MreC [Alphaproteobacteria bacterium]|nr:rod shape-determining protein MreC [Alphaproteobacteria bacterium]
MKRRKVLFVHLSHIRLMVKKFAIALLFLIAFIMMLFNKTDALLIDKTSSFATDIFSPVVELLAIPAKMVSGTLNYFYDFKDIRAENKKLREENRELVIKSSRVASLEVENHLLAKLLNYVPPKGVEYVTAKVVAEEGNAFSRALIVYTAGNDAIKKGQIVLSDKGVVGRVEKVGSVYSKILMITDINSKVPVVIERTRTRAILSGNNTSNPKLIFTPLESEIAVGDKIVTSGVAGVFPSGLPIGKVISSEKNNIQVKTFSSLDRIEYVRIVDYHLADVSYEEDINQAQEEGK